MKIESIRDISFAPYGRVHAGCDTAPLVAALKKHAPLPDGAVYAPSVPVLEAEKIFGWLQNNCFGGMPVQIGWCCGHNTRLDCLEYHRSSEFTIGAGDYVLLVALQSRIGEGFTLDTSAVKAFLAPAGAVVELYATTLHYTPCNARAGEGFKVAVALPKGTNYAKLSVETGDPEDRMLTAANKWLLAHPGSNEAKSGARVGLTGQNIDIAEWL